MSSSVKLRPIIIADTLRARLLRQNPGMVRVSSHTIRARVMDGTHEFFFRILKGESKCDGLPGTPYRIAVYEPNSALPLFPTPIGRFDYSLVRITSSAISGLNHESASSGDKPAIRVAKEVKSEFRGLGRALMSIALNHIASEGIESIYLHNVVDSRAFRFLNDLSRSARVVESYHEKTGPIPPSEANPDDEDVVINMEIDTTREDPRYMPRVLITLRSQPREQLLATRPQSL